MKKTFVAVLVSFLACPSVHARGGDAVAGALGGLAVGTMIGSATAKDSRRSSRAEQEAIRAQEKAEQVRIDQERERVVRLEKELERRDLDRKLAETKSGDSTTTILLILVGILTAVLAGLGFMLLRKKP